MCVPHGVQEKQNISISDNKAFLKKMNHLGFFCQLRVVVEESLSISMYLLEILLQAGETVRIRIPCLKVSKVLVMIRLFLEKNFFSLRFSDPFFKTRTNQPASALGIHDITAQSVRVCGGDRQKLR